MLATTLAIAALSTVGLAAPRGLRALAERAVDTVQGPVISQSFPDPGLLLPNAVAPWYSYSTSTTVGNVPYATSSDFVTWTVHGDALPNVGSWVETTSSARIWAPDVRQVASNSYVM